MSKWDVMAVMGEAEWRQSCQNNRGSIQNDIKLVK